MFEAENTPASLAEHLVRMREYYGRNRPNSAPHSIAQQLPGVKRLGWDRNIVDAIKDTHTIDPEEIVTQLERVGFPDDRFWIEGPSFLALGFHGHSMTSQDPAVNKLMDLRRAKGAKTGFFVVANQREHSFKFWFAKEYINQDIFLETLGAQKTPPHIINGVAPECSFNDFVSVSPRGIDLNDDRLLREISERQQTFEEFEETLGEESLKTPKTTPVFGKHEKIITELFEAADFLTRYFVFLASDRFKNNATEALAEQAQLATANAKINASRIKKGKVPLVPVSKVTIDLSGEDRQKIATGSLRGVRELLGYTWVRRSRKIVSKNGVEFHRDPHDRRIPAAEDRREAMKIVTARQPVDLEIRDGRPVLIRKMAPASNEGPE